MRKVLRVIKAENGWTGVVLMDMSVIVSSVDV